jgi:hypothetical protein
MQRRNFKMPSRNYQQTQVKPAPPYKGPNRAYDRPPKGPRPPDGVPNATEAKEPARRKESDDEGRWQDDGGESSEK